MRVVVNSVKDFIKNITDDHERIVNKTVWVRIDKAFKRPDLNRDEVDVALCLSAIVGGECPFIIEFGAIIGDDMLNDPGKHTNGTDQANAHVAEVTEAANKLSLDIRPGKIEFF